MLLRTIYSSSVSMDHRFLLALLVATLSAQILVTVVVAQPPLPSSHITIQGSVFCDVCHANTFETHSYFLSGVDVHIQCKFKANSPGTTEQITFSANRTTNKHGKYKLDIPSIDGVDCADHSTIQSFCKASLIGNSASKCNFPGFKNASDEITIKSKQHNLCIYSLNPLSYRPPTKNVTLCRNKNMEFPDSLNSSKFFLPYGIPWPQLPPLQPLPPFPFPPLPPFSQMPFPQPPPLPFPFPPIPPFFPTPSRGSPSLPPGFNLGNPKTWIPNNPGISPPPTELISPPPPEFSFGDPRTWIVNYPPFSPPPGFNLEDPRTWIGYKPPSPTTELKNQHP